MAELLENAVQNILRLSNLEPQYFQNPVSTSQLASLHTEHGIPGVGTRFFPCKRGTAYHWEPPIKVNTSGIARVETALHAYEETLGVGNLFVHASDAFDDGIVFLEGGAREPDKSWKNTVGPDTRGNVTRLATPSYKIWYTCNERGFLNGRYFIRLGSHDAGGPRDDDQDGDPSLIAQHELAHALGLFSHFEGFGVGDCMCPEVFAALRLLYRLPPKSTIDDLRKSKYPV